MNLDSNLLPRKIVSPDLQVSHSCYSQAPSQQEFGLIRRRPGCVLTVYFCPVHSFLGTKKTWLEFTKTDLNTAHLPRREIENFVAVFERSFERTFEADEDKVM